MVKPGVKLKRQLIFILIRRKEKQTKRKNEKEKKLRETRKDFVKLKETNNDKFILFINN